MHTDIKTALAFGLPAAALLALAACGGGGGSATTSGGGQGPTVTMPTEPTEPTEPTTPIEPTVLPAAAADTAGQAPLILLGNELRIGVVAPPAGLAPAGVHGQATVRHGRVADGVGAARLAAYLVHDATETPNPLDRVQRFEDAPVVRYVEGTTEAQAGEIVRVVRHLNAHLPRAFQLTVDPAPVSAADSEAASDIRELAHGQILIQYAAREDWHTDTNPPEGVRGGAHRLPGGGGRIAAARVWIDHTRIDPAFTDNTLIHEMVHAFGRYHSDPARFPDSTMSHGTSLAPAPGYPVQGLDGDALLAVYSVLEPNHDPDLIPTALGSWESASLHVRGDLADLAFGARLRNGLVQPWAAGPRPGGVLADNAAISGSVSWAGRLLGLPPAGDTVAGAAALGIDLGTLAGDLGFTGLESWAGAPGLAGTGAMWGDGDLAYAIAVDGNTFARTSGDEGTITGVFFGASHEGMGGTLARDDLSAGFAGTR